MNNNTYYLATEISSIQQISSLNHELFNRVYLGNPYCNKYINNILYDPDSLRQAIRELKRNNIQVIVSLPAMPSNKELEDVIPLIETSLNNDVDGFEIHSVGLLHKLNAMKITGIKTIIAGGFSNIYTSRTAQLFEQYGTSLIVPNYELPFEAVKSISECISISLEILVHGKIPLGLSEDCLLVERQSELDTSCPDSCRDGVFLEFNKWTLKNFGKLTLSGRDICLLNNIPELLEKGISNFRISGLSESIENINQWGSIYRNSINQMIKSDISIVQEQISELSKTSRFGLCNGYFFGKSGHEWINAK